MNHLICYSSDMDKLITNAGENNLRRSITLGHWAACPLRHASITLSVESVLGMFYF